MAVTGNLYPFIEQQALSNQPAMSFLHDRFSDLETWRSEARGYLRSLMQFNPEPVDLAPELIDQTDFPDYVQQKWYFTSSPGERVPLMLLLPRNAAKPTPAILALHCHSGMYYFGKKKLIEEENEPQILVQLRDNAYGGKAIACELARQGYIVAVIDSFYFGERRLDVPPPEELQRDFLLAAEGSDRWIQLLNEVSSRMESLVAKSLFWAGVTWPGILAWDDMRTVDFLHTIPDVDTERIGCVGLSMGGLRAGLLGAVDPRVKAVCVVGWMSTLTEMLEREVSCHSWSCFIPGLTKLLDWPDLVSLHAPNPLLVLQGSRDELFPLKGYQKATERLRSIYAKAGAPGNLDVGLFDLPHTFSEEMQRHAWAFFANAFDREGDI